jgi:DNA-binding NarL/FixJ family response regulator
MTELVERITTIFLPRGRPTKFTPARIQQIRTLVERGKSREEIAELIGVTVGSLQVTCSRSSGSSCSRHRSGVCVLASSSARSLQQRWRGTFFGKRRI